LPPPIDGWGRQGQCDPPGFKHIDPTGLRIAAFSEPTPDEKRQDFLRRAANNLPLQGEIGVFNRSYYEEVLITRLHPEMLATQGLSDEGEAVWKNRLKDIAAYEGYLGRQNFRIVKIFLHISQEEQRRRFLRRLDRPDKIWKFDAADMAERKRWDEYVQAYEQAIAATSSPEAPWFILPADHKWVARLLLATAIRQVLESMDPKFPDINPKLSAAAKSARQDLC
jgi:PPK2 family polyphosphate:nucleotide phosphotransferase